MQIYGPAYLHGPQSINAPHSNARTSQTSAASSSFATGDSVEISDAALQAEQQTSGIRQDLVNSIKQQIADGTYDTPDKMSAALDNFINQLG